MKRKIINLCKFMYIFSLLFLLNGCFLTYYSAKVLPRGGTEMGTGIAGSVTSGSPVYNQSLFFIRKGIGHKMDIGLDIGVLYVSLDARKQIIDESKYIPLTSVSCNAIVYTTGLGIGAGPGISLQLSKGNIFSVSKYIYSYYNGSDFWGGSVEGNMHYFIENVGIESNVCKDIYIAPLVGVTILKGSIVSETKISGLIGISLVFK